MLRVARFGTICIILKTGKAPMDRLQPVTLLKVTLLHGCFSHFQNMQMVTNHAMHLIFFNDSKVFQSDAQITRSVFRTLYR